ncbi:MAG: hypothetical protein AAF489_09285 [Bacteroidota bacterium]
MNKTTTLIAFFALMSTVTYAVECEVAYQDATYGFQHAETAMEANNVEQLKQYANRSKVAIEKVLLSTEKCGCQDANNASYDALANLDKALEKDKFEAVRLFVSRAKVNAKDIIVALDICSATDPSFALKETESNILAQEKLLLEQQQKLLEQQQKLQAQIKEQQRLQNEITAQKKEMLELQKSVRLASELDLRELETLINSFTKTMGCKDTQPLTESSYLKTEDELELETLEATKVFYAEKAKEMANNLLNRLSSCEWKTEE